MSLVRLHPLVRRSRRLLRGAAACLLLCVAGRAAGLDPGRPITQFGLDVWQRKQGLPAASVAALLQTRDGYVWVGTEEGLARFDGSRFVLFDRRNTPALDRHNVTTLLEGRDGTLWIGTLGGGLKRLRNGSFESFTTKEGLPENIVSALLEEPDGTLWIGTFSRGIARWKDGRFSPLTTRNGLSSDEIRSLYRAPDGAVWIGTRGGGVNRLQSGRVRAWTTREGLSNDQVTDVCGDGAGGVWVATRDGLNRIGDGVISVYRKREGLSDDAVISLALDRSGSLWAGTVGGGLDRFAGGRWTAVSRAQGLSSETVRCIREDRDGSLWIGTAGGLDRLRPGRFVSYGIPEGLSSDNVRPILESRDGSLWIGTLGGGVNRFKGGVFEAFTTKQGVASDRVWSLHEDASGALWVGTREGVSRFADGKWTTYRKADGLSNDLVLSIASDRDGAVWFGTAGGLDRWKDGKFTSFSKRDGLSNERVTAIVPGRDGSLWIGTMGGGLDRGIGEQFEIVGDERLRDAFVNDVLPDPDGTVWVGTGQGLFRLRNGRWTVFTTKEGLFDDVVFRILEDGRRNLWMSSNRGVFRVSRDELDALADGRAGAVSSISYGTSDGMRESECNGAFQPAGWRARDGRLWFPTVQGVVVVDPARALVTRPPPRTIIEAVAVDHQRVSLERALRLPAGAGRFEIEYTAIDLLSPEKLRFQYRLDGFDRRWIDAAGSRTASYTNVPAGSYRFRVRAQNGDGVWSSKNSELSFSIAARFYRTWWFTALAGIGLVLGAAVGHRARLKSARLKAELATTRLQALRAQLQPHFLFNSINIILPLIYRDADAASKTLVLLSDLLRRTLEWEAGQRVPLREEIEFVRKYLEIQLVRFPSRLTIRIFVEPDVSEAAVPSLILQPLVENAIVHGISKSPGRGEIEIACRREGLELVLRVWNTLLETGGPAPAPRTHGVGLRNVRDRLSAIYGRNGELTASAEPGGFAVTIRLPLVECAESSPELSNGAGPLRATERRAGKAAIR